MNGLKPCWLLSCALIGSASAANARDWTMAPGIPTSELPVSTLTAGLTSPLRIRSGEPEHDAFGPQAGSPMLERIFAGSVPAAARRHTGTYAFRFAGLDLTLEGERQRTTAFPQVLDASNRSQKIWALGLASNWQMGSGTLSLGIATAKQRGSAATLLANKRPASTSSLAAELALTHPSGWSVSLGLRQDGGGGGTGVERLLEVAAGSPLHQRSARVAFTFMPGGEDGTHGTSFGLEARDGIVSPADLAVIGGSRRNDMQAKLFFRARF